LNRPSQTEKELDELAAALQIEKGPLLAILGAIGDGVSVQDMDMRILYTNETHKHWFGEDVVGKKCYEVYQRNSVPCDGCPLQEAMRTGKVSRAVRQGIGADGLPIMMEIVAAAVRNSEGVTVAGVEVVRDISEQLHASRELEQKTERLQRLNEVARDISSGLDLSPLLRRIVEHAAALTDADAGTIALLDEARGVITYPYHFNMPEELSTVEVGRNEGIAGKVMSSRKPVILDEYSSDPAQLGAFSKAGVRAILAVPIIISGRPLGALGLFGKRPDKKFTPEDAGLVITIAGQAAVAIENARLFEETVGRLRTQRELNRAAINITADLDGDVIMKRAVVHAARLARSDAAMVALVDSDRHIIKFPYGVNLPPELTQVTCALGEGVAGRVIAECRAMIVNDYAGIADSKPEFVDAGITAVATVPLKVGNRCIGAIGVMDRGSGHQFSQEDVDLLVIISGEVAVAMENARLYGELSEAAQKLEQRVRDRTEALSRMYQESENKGRQLMDANRKLRELDRLKSEFLANMSHELRTPMNAIIGFSKLILDGIDGGINNEQKRDVEIIHANGQNLLRLIDDLLDLAKIEAGRTSITLAPTDVTELVNASTLTMSAAASEKGLTLKQSISPGLPTVMLDTPKIRQTLLNLISNAIKYTEAGTITVSVERHPDGFVFAVTDSGIGLSDDEMHSAFDRFQQFEAGLAQTGGVGLGLTISKRFVEMHGGRIWVESQAGQGSTFSFLIPDHAAGDAQA
jgi:signal transduction histidine kinase/PAS domain-containing protein